jgi:hypothetical protein
MGEWRYSSIILDLGTRWRWVVSFTYRPLYPRGNRPRYLLVRRLGGPQSWSKRCRELKNVTPSGNRTPAFQPVARHNTDWSVPTPTGPTGTGLYMVLVKRLEVWWSGLHRLQVWQDPPQKYHEETTPPFWNQAPFIAVPSLFVKRPCGGVR